ncbi:MAG: hypothetical protein AAF211_30720, partial [Myxococcota bacterium]
VVELLRHAGWEVEGTTGEVGAGALEHREVTLSVAHARAFLGTDEDAGELGERLERYGFGVTMAGDTLTCVVPSWRLPDVHHEADLLEELAKSIGYDRTPIELPVVGLGAPPSAWEQRRDRIEEVLLGHGFFEVYTDGFYSRRVTELLGFDEGHPLRRHVETLNAIDDRAYSLLKNNCAHQMLDAVATNERRRTLSGQMFEWTRTFHPTDGATLDGPPAKAVGPAIERPLLWGACFGGREGTPLDALFLTGVVRAIATETGLPLVVDQLADHPLATVLHPGRRGVIRLGDDVVGVIGEIHPAVLPRYKIKRLRPCYFEIDQGALQREGGRPDYVEPPKHQPIVRTVALAVPPPTPADAVRRAFVTSGPAELQRVDVVDVFVAVEDRSEVRSLTFELSYDNDDNQRTADDVNQATETLVAAVLEQFRPAGVQRR